MTCGWDVAKVLNTKCLGDKFLNICFSKHQSIIDSQETILTKYCKRLNQLTYYNLFVAFYFPPKFYLIQFVHILVFNKLDSVDKIIYVLLVLRKMVPH